MIRASIGRLLVNVALDFPECSKEIEVVEPGYSKDLETNAYTEIRRLFGSDASSTITMSYFNTRMSRSALGDELFSYIGKTAVKRLQFLMCRDYVFRVNNDEISLQLPEITETISRLSSYILCHGGWVPMKYIHDYYKDNVFNKNSSLDFRNLDSFIAFLSLHEFAFAVFPKKDFVSAIKKLPSLEKLMVGKKKKTSKSAKKKTDKQSTSNRKVDVKEKVLQAGKQAEISLDEPSGACKLAEKDTDRQGTSDRREDVIERLLQSGQQEEASIDRNGLTQSNPVSPIEPSEACKSTEKENDTRVDVMERLMQADTVNNQPAITYDGDGLKQRKQISLNQSSDACKSAKKKTDRQSTRVDVTEKVLQSGKQAEISLDKPAGACKLTEKDTDRQGASDQKEGVIERLLQSDKQEEASIDRNGLRQSDPELVSEPTEACKSTEKEADTGVDVMERLMQADTVNKQPAITYDGHGISQSKPISLNQSPEAFKSTEKKTDRQSTGVDVIEKLIQADKQAEISLDEPSGASTLTESDSDQQGASEPTEDVIERLLQSGQQEEASIDRNGSTQSDPVPLSESPEACKSTEKETDRQSTGVDVIEKLLQANTANNQPTTSHDGPELRKNSSVSFSQPSQFSPWISVPKADGSSRSPGLVDNIDASKPTYQVPIGFERLQKKTKVAKNDRNEVSKPTARYPNRPPQVMKTMESGMQFRQHRESGQLGLGSRQLGFKELDRYSTKTTSLTPNPKFHRDNDFSERLWNNQKTRLTGNLESSFGTEVGTENRQNSCLGRTKKNGRSKEGVLDEIKELSGLLGSPSLTDGKKVPIGLPNCTCKCTCGSVKSADSAQSSSSQVRPTRHEACALLDAVSKIVIDCHGILLDCYEQLLKDQ